MSESLSIQDALKLAVETLATHSEAASLEAEVLLAHALGTPRSYLHAWPEKLILVKQGQRFFELIARRFAGEPIAYLTGFREFWSLELRVNPHTLIPRPETELLVELALKRLPLDSASRVADLGTGSGAIALAIASERPRCHVTATDICPDALAVARANAERLNISNVEFREGTWFAPLRNEGFDLTILTTNRCGN